MPAVKALTIWSVTCRQSSRKLSTRVSALNSDAIARRDSLFSNEVARQKSLVQRVEKIRVEYLGLPKPCLLAMNKQISTPYDCAKHLPQNIRDMSPLAIVDGQPWDLHRPLEKDCTLDFAHFKDLDESRLLACNRSFWRTCCFLLGYVADRSFKDEYSVKLHSWPAPRIETGSFVYDVNLSLDNWIPSGRDLRLMSSVITRMSLSQERIERLEVSTNCARDIFQDNEFKAEQITDMASDDGKVVLYRCNGHVDVSVGPMIGNVKFVSAFEVVSVHPLETSAGMIYRFQGIAHPSAFTMSPFSRRVLKARAMQLNTSGLPQEGLLPDTQVAPEEIEDDRDDEPEAHKAAQ